jgi:hypothetical protein
MRKKIFPSTDATFNIIPFDGECYVKINGTEYKISVLSDSLPQECENMRKGSNAM